MAYINRVSNAQLNDLLEFLSEHPNLAKGVGLGARSKESVDKQWDIIATKLNSHGSGSSKSRDRWKKYWADIKHKSKARLAQRRRDALRTGGGPSRQDDLSEVDKKILSIIGEQVPFCDSEHLIPFISIEQTTPEKATSLEGNKADDVLVIVISETSVALPSTSGQTYNLNTSEISETGSMSAKMDLDTEQPLTGLDSPVERPRVDRTQRRKSRMNKFKNSNVKSRIDIEWVKELETRRVDAETKIAEALLLMAESAQTQAEAAKTQAETMRSIVDVVHTQSQDIQSLIQLICNTKSSFN